MTQRLLHDLHLYYGGQHQRGCAVAEIVEADGSQAGEVEKVKTTAGKISAKRLLPLAQTAGCAGSARELPASGGRGEEDLAA
ncbi:hypothetical protein ACI2LC_39365 [Nonomuraea wenchangensis]|uniref:hypothetical protein n=1 Tax=Nonomuraea wenchangensis TaxID=568860 RepID=UPI00384B980F